MPQVAVVTPCRNMAGYIGETIESVLGQSLGALEMIVVDDGSSDDTRQIVEGFHDPRLRLISTGGIGVSAARNLGLDTCQAPLVVFLDADDLLFPRTLEHMVRAMTAQRDRVACFAHHVKIGEDGALLSSADPATLKKLPADDTLRHLLRRNFIVNGGAICVRVAAARRIGGYDPTLAFAEDWEFWCRLAALGDFLALPDLVAMRYRIRARGANTSLSGSPFRPNLSAVDRIFRAPALRDRFGEHELASLRRAAESNVHWAAARNELGLGQIVRFLGYLVVGAFRYPDSIFQWRLTYAFFRGLPLAWHRG